MFVIIHLVPQLPPAVSGVGDYALLVGSRIEELYPEVRCGYIACGNRAVDWQKQFPGRRNLTGSCSGQTLWTTVKNLIEEFGGHEGERVGVVVHYSGYGYDRYGAPLWLAAALEQAPEHLSLPRIVTMFHEIYAMSPPWRRAFWFSPRQRSVARRIAVASQSLMTNRDKNARWLKRAVGDERVVVALPIASNVGEPQSVASWEERDQSAVAFGGLGNKQVLLGKSAARCAAALQQLGITKLLDVGPPAPVRTSEFNSRGIDVEQLGFCDSETVSRLLLSCRVGLIDYPANCLGKSGVVAAYAAHGLAVVGRCAPDRDSAPPFPVLSIDRPVPSSITPSVLADAGRRIRLWYADHASSDHAEALVRLIADSSARVKA